MTREETKKYLEGYLLNMKRAMQLKRDRALYAMAGPSITQEINKCIRECEKIEDFISSAISLRKREVLVRKYIYAQSLEKIADELNYSVRQIQRILNEAVDELSCKIK